MSRTPITALTDRDAHDSSAPALIRLQRAIVGVPGDGDAPMPLSFELYPGGSHLLAGGAGSGKTALLEMIGLARPPASGGLHLFGQDVGRVPPSERYALRRRIGMMFQDLRLVDDLSVYDNVALAARAAGRGPGAYGREINELLAWVGLGRRTDALAGALGEEARRRLALARAVINRPDVVIADEPAGEGDEAVLRLLADLNEAGTAVLVATRDGDLAARAGTEVTYLARFADGLGLEPGA